MKTPDTLYQFNGFIRGKKLIHIDKEDIGDAFVI